MRVRGFLATRTHTLARTPCCTRTHLHARTHARTHAQGRARGHHNMRTRAHAHTRSRAHQCLRARRSCARSCGAARGWGTVSTAPTGRVSTGRGFILSDTKPRGIPCRAAWDTVQRGIPCRMNLCRPSSSSAADATGTLRWRRSACALGTHSRLCRAVQPAIPLLASRADWGGAPPLRVGRRTFAAVRSTTWGFA